MESRLLTNQLSAVTYQPITQKRCLSPFSELRESLPRSSVMPRLHHEVPNLGRREHLGDTSGPEPELSRALPQGGLDHFRLLRS